MHERLQPQYVHCVGDHSVHGMTQDSRLRASNKASLRLCAYRGLVERRSSSTASNISVTLSFTLLSIYRDKTSGVSCKIEAQG